jgi:hypothetical protein
MSDTPIHPNEQLGQDACAYAREQIIDGGTQLVNNQYHPAKRRALRQAVSDMRKAARKTEFLVDIDKSLRFFEAKIEKSKQLSIGNCQELALMAMHHVLISQSKATAEVYHIEGGDHAFLVIGRKKESKPHEPETWGEDAYICDPWSNSVYPATEYLTKTKNFFSTRLPEGDYKNNIEDFNPSKHKLSPIPNQNKDYILSTTEKSNKILLEVFATMNERYLTIYDKLANDLQSTANHLKKKYGEHDPKFQIIQTKINEIRTITNELRKESNVYQDKIKKQSEFQSHKQLDTEVQVLMKKQLHQFKKISTLVEKDQTQLTAYRQSKEDSLVVRIKDFLQIKPTSARAYQLAIKTATKETEGLKQTLKPTR